MVMIQTRVRDNETKIEELQARVRKLEELLDEWLKKNPQVPPEPKSE